MSFINPQKVPVKVYLSTDKDAPKNSVARDNFATILKACLVTGYGDKQGAGWSLPFEDTDKGVKVFHCPAKIERSYELKISDDNGKSASVQIYTDMTTIDDGNLLVQCNTPYRYNVGKPTGNWMMLVSDRAFWFFTENNNDNNIKTKFSGSYLYCGDTLPNANGRCGLYLKHTGGNWGDNDDDRYYLFSSGTDGATIGKFYDFTNNQNYDVNPKSLFSGVENITDDIAVSPVYLLVNRTIWTLPAYAPSKNNQENYTKLNVSGIPVINHATAMTSAQSNLYIPCLFWGL